MKIALIHDWLVTYAGSERVLEQILLLYPEADLYSLVDFIPEVERGFILNKKVRTSFIQNMPLARTKYRNYLPLMPFAIETFDLSEYDLIISSSHAVAKGVKTGGTLHICYCHTPMRYAWDLSSQYLDSVGMRGFKRSLAKMVFAYVRKWDLSTANRVNYFIANSHYIAERIKRVYGHDSTVIYPPVDINAFELGNKRGNFYLVVSRMVPYKKVDLIVEAFAQMPDKRLVVIGDGPDMNKIRLKSTRNIELLGYQPTEMLKDYLQRAKAFVFMAEEDFGITLVEAQACGTPIITFGKGGATETVVENKTGIFFKEQAVDSLIAAVKEFEKMEGGFDSHEIRKNTERFDKQRFKTEFKSFVEKCLSLNK